MDENAPKWPFVRSSEYFRGMAFGFPNVSPRSVLEPFRGFLTVRSEIVQASFRPDSGRVQQNSRCEAQAVTSCLPSLATAA
ncbi:hypothetical protein, partial [Pseudomonas aeruginosa]|uniref:hypothetical protein n=2 Tax=Pseudomonas aeruginosa TaxID=287 RepID=UPI001C6540B2